MLLFLVPADSMDIRADYETLLHELEKYNPELLEKQRLLAVSKSDLLDDELRAAVAQELEGLNPIFFSSVAQQGLGRLKDQIWSAIHADPLRP